MVELLDQLVRDIPDMTGCMVVGRDGVVIKANLQQNLSVDYLAAITASVTALSDCLLSSAESGALDRIRIVGTQGQLLGVPIADDVSLMMLARRSIDADKAFEGAERAALVMSQYL